MFRNERHADILYLLARDGRVATAELAERYEVSEDSIRKDLQQLDLEGRLKRVYGGAVCLEELPERRVVARADAYAEEKREVARKAFDLIDDESTIFLDVSSTNLFLADLIAASEKRLIVVSNMFDLLSRVAAGSNVDAQCPGGQVNAELNGLVGGTTTRALSRERFDMAFLGTINLDIKNDEVTTFDSEDAAVKMTVLERSDRVFVVADAHKFNVKGSYRYARLSDFEAIITDGSQPEWTEAARNAGFNVL